MSMMSRTTQIVPPTSMLINPAVIAHNNTKTKSLGSIFSMDPPVV